MLSISIAKVKFCQYYVIEICFTKLNACQISFYTVCTCIYLYVLHMGIFSYVALVTTGGSLVFSVDCLLVDGVMTFTILQCKTMVWWTFLSYCIIHYSCGVSCLQELIALSKVKRFSVAVMFLSTKDKQSKFEIYDFHYNLLHGRVLNSIWNNSVWKL